MQLSDAARLNGVAVTGMQKMLRTGETFRLPSALSAFIAAKGWESVEYIDPETSGKVVAAYQDLPSWVEASPARGGLGSRLVKVAEFIGRPLDSESAAECVKRLAESLPIPELIALKPMLLGMAAANKASTGDKRWNAVIDAIDARLKDASRPGSRTDLVDNIHEVSSRPTGTSREAGIRRLRKYATDSGACSERGVSQQQVELAYGEAVRGEVSVHKALIRAGLKTTKPKSIWIGSINGMADRIIDAMGQSKAAELVAALNQRLT